MSARRPPARAPRSLSAVELTGEVSKRRLKALELHPVCLLLKPLLGTWRGEGYGDYPSIDPFTYTEEVVFAHAGKPFLSYTQRTAGADGLPLHAECGYWRPLPPAGSAPLPASAPPGSASTPAGSAPSAGSAPPAASDSADVAQRVEVLLTQPSGIAEVLTGGLTLTHFGFLVLLNAVGVHPTPAAKQVDATERWVSVDGDTLRYRVSMAAVGHPMTDHVEATLHRVA